eukprot:16429244-Heterocapsa_arctica.AAC.1
MAAEVAVQVQYAETVMKKSAELVQGLVSEMDAYIGEGGGPRHGGLDRGGPDRVAEVAGGGL